MNAKKAKAIRRQVRDFTLGHDVTPPEVTYLYRDTQKVSGYRTPAGWNRANFVRLMTQAPNSEWAQQAMQCMVREYKRTAVLVPNSYHFLVKKTKAILS